MLDTTFYKISNVPCNMHIKGKNRPTILSKIKTSASFEVSASPCHKENIFIWPYVVLSKTK